jgi:hypothetical protein
MSITVDIGGGQIVEFPDVETAQRFMASQQGQPSTAEDVGRGFLGGALTGAGAILDLPAMIGRLPMQLSDRFLGTDMLADIPAPTPFIESVGEVAPSVQAAAEYEPQTVLGGYAQQTGEFLPGLLTPGGLPARIGYGVLAPAIGSETAGRAAEALGAGETGQMVAELAGAVVSPAAAERTIRGLISPMAGTAAPRVAAAETLREAGVPVTAGQQAGSGLLRRLEDTAAPSEEQLEALTRAALRSIGSEGDRVTSDVLNAARSRIGGVFDDVTQNLTVDVQPFRVSQLQAAANTYRSLAPTGAQAPIIDDIVNAVTNPNAQTSPRQLMTWRSRLSRLTTTPDAATREAAADALEAIDDIIADSLRNAGREADVDALNQARRQWRDYLAIERAAGQAGETAAEGLLTPGALRGAVQGQSRSQFVRGQRGDLGDITRSAQAVLSSSPAVLPGGARVIEGAGRAAMAGIGGTIGGIPGAAAGFMAPEIARFGVTSRPMQAYLRNQLVGPSPSRLTAAQRAILYGPGAGFPSVFNQGEMQ